MSPRAEQARDAGASLVEVLVAMALFTVVGGVLLGFAVSTSQVTDDTRGLTRVSEETRLGMERLTRELRQASGIDAVGLPATSTDTTSLTFWTDFNGNGARDLGAVDPEVLTYRWNPATSRLTLTVNDASGTAVTRPVLATSVSSFVVEPRSSAWQHDTDGNGTTTWQEIDQSVGDADGTPDGIELPWLDLVAITMTATDGSHDQTYSTQVDLRNRTVN